MVSPATLMTSPTVTFAELPAPPAQCCLEPSEEFPGPLRGQSPGSSCDSGERDFWEGDSSFQSGSPGALWRGARGWPGDLLWPMGHKKKAKHLHSALPLRLLSGPHHTDKPDTRHENKLCWAHRPRSWPRPGPKELPGWSRTQEVTHH